MYIYIGQNEMCIVAKTKCEKWSKNETDILLVKRG